MFLPMNYLHFYGLHNVDARRLLELQQYQYLIEKRHRLCLSNQFEPLRRLGVEEKETKQLGKPLTSFRISDILSSDDDAQKEKEKSKIVEESFCHRKRKTQSDDDSSSQDEVQSKYRHRHSSDPRFDINDETNTDRIGRFVESSHCRVLDHHLDSDKRVRGILPNNCIPKLFPRNHSISTHSCTSGSGPAFASKQPVLNRESLNTQTDRNRDLFLRLCSRQCHNDIDSDSDVEIDVEGCDDADNKKTVPSEKHGDVSPLDALVAMSSKAFMGLESFGEFKIVSIIYMGYMLICTNLHITLVILFDYNYIVFDLCSEVFLSR